MPGRDVQIGLQCADGDGAGEVGGGEEGGGDEGGGEEDSGEAGAGGLNGWVEAWGAGAALGASGALPCAPAACTCWVRSRTQRPNVSLTIVEPVSDSNQGASLPLGKVNVMDGALRNCASKVWKLFGSSVQSML
jgi:hypothetical protein